MPRAITTDANANVFLAGTFQGALTFGVPLPQANEGAIFVVKFDPNGHAL
jgi:hypothetical protein